MKPRYESRSSEVDKLLKEAKELEKRLVEKSGPGYDSQKEGSMEGPSRFEKQPGKVPNVFYNTNNVIPEVEDVANKGTSSEASNVLDKPTQFPTAISDLDYRLNDTGGDGPTMPDLKKSVDRLSSRLN